MRSYLAAFLTALLLGVILTPIARRIAIRLHAYSGMGKRHVHGYPVPRLGGLAMMIAFSVPIGALLLLDRGGVALTLRPVRQFGWGVVAGGLLMGTLGTIDDIRKLQARYKLVVQLAIATATYFAGFRIGSIQLPFLGLLDMGIFALPVTLAWIVGITNAVNLIDGLDGLAGGVAFFAALTNFTVALINGQVFLSLVMAALMGAIVGFLVFNFNPARIFMGDSGSYFLGYVLAVSAIVGSSHKTTTAVSLLIPVVALGVPIMDTSLAVVRRLVERRSLLAPDRGHIHHRLIDLGLTQRRAVLLLYGVCVLLTAAAIAISIGRNEVTGIALLLVTVVMVVVVRFSGGVEHFRLRLRQKQRVRDEQTERLRRSVPEMLHTLSQAKSLEDIANALSEMVRTAQLVGVEIIDVRAPENDVAVLVLAGDVDSEGARDIVSARYPLGSDQSACTHLKVAWRDTSEQVNPAPEILLQVAADAVAAALIRVGGGWAPGVSEMAPSMASQPPSARAPSTNR